MFTKNFMGIFHGSISAKEEDDRFIINTKDAMFDNLNEDDLITLFSKKDYRWSDASIDADIHLNIYQNISEAKYISYTMPPFMTALSLEHNVIKPKDYFGIKYIKELSIYSPKDLENWYKIASDTVYKHMISTNRDMMLIRGYGLYSYSRDLKNLIKKIAILENSCKLLYYSKSFCHDKNFPLS